MQLKQDNFKMSEIKIIQEKENPLFNRKEILGVIIRKSSPARQEIISLLSEKYSTPKDAVKIKNILGKFGSREFKISANIYSSKKDKDAVELKKKKEIDMEKKINGESAKKEKKSGEENVGN